MANKCVDIIKTLTEWTEKNPTLHPGVLYGVRLGNVLRLKYGDGRNFNNTPYLSLKDEIDGVDTVEIPYWAIFKYRTGGDPYRW